MSYIPKPVFKPYVLPVDDIKKAFEPYVPPKAWEPSVGDFVHTFRPFKVYKDHGNGWFEICDDNGNCLTASKKELHEHFYKSLNTDYIMKAMKDAVATTAKSLLKANNTVTTLEVKTELRRDFPYYFWTQDIVSNYMSQLAGDGLFTYTDNGTYRIYSLATATVAPSTKTFSTAKSVVKSVFGKVSGRIPTKGKTSKFNTISRTKVLKMAADPRFTSVTLANGKVISVTDIRNQKKSAVGYISPKAHSIQAITLAGITYNVK